MTGASISADTVLATRDLHMAFGGLVVFDKLNFELKRGERHAIIGPNGAGKTTFVNLVTGLHADVRRGPARGADITGLSRAARQARLARTFQINTLFRGLTGSRSVVLACASATAWPALSVRPRRPRAGLIEEAYELLAVFGLRTTRCAVPTRSYGGQRLLEIAIALALKPQVLLLDEPAAGVPTARAQRHRSRRSTSARATSRS